MSSTCAICERILAIRSGVNPLFVAELVTGYVVLADFQLWRGYTIFLCKEHAEELHHLDREFRLKFLEEMSLVAEAVYRAFSPVKLNYELLGNSDPHVHWHIIPRYRDDTAPNQPIWLVDRKLRCSEEARPSAQVIQQLKKSVLEELRKLSGVD
ncbi:MAG TPA: HIT family protein [Tepidisphaeraceae bacterium]|nr:HIT family protein [Tepidisphaeraceae bacterium]